MIKNLKDWIIRSLGGYTDIDSAIEAIKERGSAERYTILTLAVKKLFNTIDANDILRIHEDGSWMCEGKPLNKAMQQLLIAESKQIVGMELWKVLQLDIKYQSNRKMYLLAKDEMQIVAGKLWMFTFDALKTRIESLQKGSPTFNSKNAD